MEVVKIYVVFTQNMVIIHSSLFDDFAIGDDVEPRIMGVVNLSKESFYSKSYIEPDAINFKVKNFIEEGASIIDIGGRSTAPWSDKITINEEKNRVLRVLDEILDLLPTNVTLSIDTQYSEVARVCLDSINLKRVKLIINDVSNLKTDPKMKNLLTEFNIPTILMASKKVPGDCLTIDEIKTELLSSISELVELGYEKSKIIVDPGVGRWIDTKTYEYDLKIISQLESLRTLGLPILMALSRKSFIKTALGRNEPEDRYFGSLASTAISVYNGAHIIRTHDVNEAMRDTVSISYQLKKQRKFQ